MLTEAGKEYLAALQDPDPVMQAVVLLVQNSGQFRPDLILEARSKLQQIEKEEGEQVGSQPKAISWEESHRQIVSMLGYDPT